MDTHKLLGKISSAEFGMIPDHPYLMGLQFTFRFGDGGGVGDGGRYTENISEHCIFTTKTRADAITAIVDKTADILKAAKVHYVSELVNMPVEVTLEGNLFKSFRILTEEIREKTKSDFLALCCEDDKAPPYPNCRRRKYEEGISMGNNIIRKTYVIDTETTGLDRGKDEILQLSIIDESGCTVYNSLFRPERHTSWENAEKINHITPEMTANAPTFKEMLPIINEIFSYCGVVIGYNTGFDLAFLQAAGVEFPESMRVIDVQAMFMPIAGEWDWQQNKYKWQSLVECAEYCGYEWQGEAHDSLADAMATLYCYNSLVIKNAIIISREE